MQFKTFEELVLLAPQEIKDELERLKTYQENSLYHPESNVYEHIKIVTDRLITTGDIDLILAGLYHDIMKLKAAEKTLEKTGKFRAFGHEQMGSKIVQRDVEFIKDMGADVDMVESIVLNHMRMKKISEMKKSKVEILKSLPAFEKLMVFTKADNMLTEFKFDEIPG